MQVKYTGILKLALDDAALKRVLRLQNDALPEQAIPLSENDLHVTLVHQNILKPHKKVLRSIEFPQGPDVDVDDAVFRIDRGDRTSWIALVKNWNEMQEYVNALMLRLGEPPNPEKRVFHVSLANLIGSPYASVGDVKHSDIWK